LIFLISLQSTIFLCSFGDNKIMNKVNKPNTSNKSNKNSNKKKKKNLSFKSNNKWSELLRGFVKGLTRKDLVRNVPRCLKPYQKSDLKAGADLQEAKGNNPSRLKKIIAHRNYRKKNYL